MSSTVIVTVELGIESPEAGITLLPVGDDLDLPLIVHGFGTVTGTLLTLDGQSIPVGTTSLTSTLLGSLGLSTFGPHQLSVSADDAAGNAHSASGASRSS